MNMATNMRVLKPSRVKPKKGDVFTFSIDEKIMFGRVISTEAMAGWSMPGAILIYLFCTRADSMEIPDRVDLQLTNLLVSPMMTNRLPWSRGYFQTVGNLPLADGEVCSRHCFRSSQGRYFDEAANELPGPLEPCGDWGLHSFRIIDDAISGALMLPLAVDD